MDLLNRTTGRLLEPLFAFLAAHTPDPFVISDATAPLNLLAHVPVLVLACLLFSPHDSWLVRAALVPLAVAATFYLGFKFRFTHPAWGEKDKGMSMTAVYWSMKAVELGLRRERPLWVGWEFDEGQARATRQAKANAADTWRERAYLAVCYCYSYRSLGWSTGASRSRFCVPAPASSRWRAAAPYLLKAAVLYLLWDAVLGLFALHPTFATLAAARKASIYQPLLPALPLWLSGLTVALGWGVLTYLAQAFPAALVAGVSIVLSPDWRTTALHSPPMFKAWWAAQSMVELWGWRWHTMYRSTMTFLAFQPASRVGGRVAGVLATFLLSGLFHSAGYFSTDPLDKALAIKMLDFFVLCGLAVGAEAAFTRLTGRRVGGPLGRLWMWAVLLVAGTPLSEAWLRCGGAVGLGAGPEGTHHMPFGRPVVWLGRRIVAWVERAI